MGTGSIYYYNIGTKKNIQIMFHVKLIGTDIIGVNALIIIIALNVYGDNLD